MFHFANCPASHFAENPAATAGARARSSASMQRRGIRTAVQIMVCYQGETSICAIVSYSKLSLFTKHTRRIAFHVANPSFFEHVFWLSSA